MTQEQQLTIGEKRLSEILDARFDRFKLELVHEFEKYATKEAHGALERLVTLLTTRVTELELWRARLTGSDNERRTVWDGSFKWATLLVAALGAVATIVWLHHG